MKNDVINDNVMFSIKIINVDVSFFKRSCAVSLKSLLNMSSSHLLPKGYFKIVKIAYFLLLHKYWCCTLLTVMY